MSKIKFFILALVAGGLTAFISSQVFPRVEWEQTSGPMEEFIRAIPTANRNVYNVFCRQRTGRTLMFTVNAKTGNVSPFISVFEDSEKPNVFPLGSHEPCAAPVED